jgi:hypothetical protein
MLTPTFLAKPKSMKSIEILFQYLNYHKTLFLQANSLFLLVTTSIFAGQLQHFCNQGALLRWHRVRVWHEGHALGMHTQVPVQVGGQQDHRGILRSSQLMSKWGYFTGKKNMGGIQESRR